MENQNENMTNAQGQDLSQLKQMFNDYQKEASQTSTRRSSEDRLSKYFVPRKTKESFRILPPKPGHEYIDKAFFHVVPTTIAGGKTKHNTVLYCPAHNDPKVPKVDAEGNPVLDSNGNQVMTPAPCPLCEKAKKMLAKQDPSLKGKKKEDLTPQEKVIWEKNREIFKEANVWQAKKFYIVRGIDKGAEKDGVKFWRFKHNFKKQGTYDKLMPILNEYVDFNQADFTHPVHGTDLSITMADTEWNGIVYKQISAISTRGKSKLHEDPLVAKQWLEDDTSWRDVFKPRQAPLITPYQYLEMVAEGTAPYWEDSDQNNKHWVYPGRPELQEQANTRNRDLDAEEDENFEQASDIVAKAATQVTVSNVTSEDVGEYKDTTMDVVADAKKNIAPQPTQPETVVEIPQPVVETKAPPTPTVTNEDVDEGYGDEEDTGDYEDLPF